MTQALVTVIGVVVTAIVAGSLAPDAGLMRRASRHIFGASRPRVDNVEVRPTNRLRKKLF